MNTSRRLLPKAYSIPSRIEKLHNSTSHLRIGIRFTTSEVNSLQHRNHLRKHIQSQTEEEEARQLIRGKSPSIRPFPSPFHIGTDVCHIPRILKTLTQSAANRNPTGDPKANLNLTLLHRLLTEPELARFNNIQFSNLDKIANYIAGR